MQPLVDKQRQYIEGLYSKLLRAQFDGKAHKVETLRGQIDTAKAALDEFLALHPELK